MSDIVWYYCSSGREFLGDMCHLILNKMVMYDMDVSDDFVGFFLRCLYVFVFCTLEKRRYVHPTGFNVQYRDTDTENSNPNIMISGFARKCMVLNFHIVSNLLYS